MIAKLVKEVRFLKIYAAVITLMFGFLALSVFRQAAQKTKFAEIDVERINVVEKDGRLKMVISNSERQHPGVVEGKIIPRQGAREPGIIFFNERGDECGGLAFAGDLKDGQANASALLAFDRFRQDQTVGIQYGERNGQYSAGLRVWDRPETSLVPVIEKVEAIRKMSDGPEKTAALEELRKTSGAAERVMVGRDHDKAAVIKLSDAKGNPRIKMSVDKEGTPMLIFLDETGKVTFSLPQESQAGKK